MVGNSYLLCMCTLSREQVRRLDRIAIEQLGIPGVVLMENAGMNASRCIIEALETRWAVTPSNARVRVRVLCGGGNNGGDGYVIARHLHNYGMAVGICATREPADAGSDAAIHAEICTRMGIEITTPADSTQWPNCHVLVDSLLGTGFSGQVRPDVARIIDRVNALKGPRVVAVDLPSGLDCDTGQAEKSTIKADLTVTFVARKIGFDRLESRDYTGQVLVAGIGTPPQLITDVRRSP